MASRYGRPSLLNRILEQRSRRIENDDSLHKMYIFFHAVHASLRLRQTKGISDKAPLEVRAVTAGAVKL